MVDCKFMCSEIRRYVKKLSIIYNKKGIKGLGNATIAKVKLASLPIIYRNTFFRKFQHPKIGLADLELTNKCNLRCVMCNWQKRKKTGFISRELFENCVNQFSELEVGTLNLNGAGESLVHPDFVNLLDYALQKRDKGKIGSVGWTTNGMLFNQDIADFAVSRKVDWINFSLDGVGLVNDNIRIGSNYSIIEKNIKYLLKKRENAKRPRILLNMVDHGKTEEQKEEFFDLWVQFVDEIELIPSILPDNTWENIDILSTNIKLAPSPAFCSIPLETMIVCWDGLVLGCCFDTDLKIILGDANIESLKQIWNGTKYQNFRKMVLTNSFPDNSPCKRCEFWKINFEPELKLILNGKAQIEYDRQYRRIRKVS